MEPNPKQVNSNKPQQLTPQQIVQQAAKTTTQIKLPKSKKKSLIIGALVIFGIFAVITIILFMISRGSGSKQNNNGNNQEIISEKTNPVKVVFVRDGNIWMKDIQNNIEEQIRDTSGQRVNRLLISNDGLFFGMILFDESLFVAQQNDYGQVFIFDLEKNESINIGAVEFDSANVNEDKYFFTDSCDLINEEYISFCKEYGEYLKDSNDGRIKPYNIEVFSDSSYKKESYKLTRSKKLTNGLVLAEFENNDGEGYTILAYEESNEIIISIEDSTGSSFLFN